MVYDRIFRWRTCGQQRLNMPCRVIAKAASRDGFNARTALVEFSDGHRAITSWRGTSARSA